MKDYNKKFDIQLRQGQMLEEQLKQFFTGQSIEVKSERGRWMETGNICIEYESWGKPSGIKATESDYWFHNLCVGDKEFCTIVFDTNMLRIIVNQLDSFKTVTGGDHNASKMYLVSLQKLFSDDVIKAFKEKLEKGQKNVNKK